MRGLLVALLALVSAGSASAADKYLNADRPLSTEFQNVVSFSVVSGTTYKLSALLFLTWTDGQSGEPIVFQTRFGGSATGELVTDNGTTSRGQARYLHTGSGQTGLAVSTRLSGTFKATSNGTLSLQMKHDSEIASVSARHGSLVALDELN